MVRVAVTGAGGFVGRATVPALAKAGVDVVALARTRGADMERVQWVVGDLHDPSVPAPAVDTVIHLAGSASSSEARANENLAAAAVSWARRAGASRLVHVSTYGVWGDRKTPARVGDERAPLDAYAQAKARAEDVARGAARAASLEIGILRLPSVYGEGGRGIVDIARARLVRGEELAISSDFRNMFLHVDDVARALVEIADQAVLPAESNLEGETLSGRELADLVRKLGGRVAFTDVPGRSYAQEGWRVHRSIDVTTYLALARSSTLA